jgi:hypothetical protein
MIRKEDAAALARANGVGIGSAWQQIQFQNSTATSAIQVAPAPRKYKLPVNAPGGANSPLNGQAKQHSRPSLATGPIKPQDWCASWAQRRFTSRSKARPPDAARPISRSRLRAPFRSKEGRHLPSGRGRRPRAAFMLRPVLRRAEIGR